MLEPQSRQLLFEALRPPPGYTLDRAIGTTYGLDLLALMTAPLAFTFFSWETEEGRPMADPLALLEALRRNASRISIFCQAGQIKIPNAYQPLFPYIETSVFEATSPRRHGAFHPKFWVLRFTAPDEPVAYRLLCLSRNLTFDRSWDTVLAMDGKLTQRTRAYHANHPLGDFVAALPGLAIRPLPKALARDIDRIQNEVRRVDFEVPDGFDAYRFWPFGIDGAARWPFDKRIDRLMIVSPFLSNGCLQRLSGGRDDDILVSLAESLAEIGPARREQFGRVCVLQSGATGGDEAETELDEAVDETSGDDPTLSGLHAKLYVADAGWNAQVWTGSANATNAAFESNVEFMVELEGKKSFCGIDALLAKAKGQVSLADLLEDYAPDADAPGPDKEQEHLEALLEDARRRIAGAALCAVVTPQADEQAFDIALTLTKRKDVELPEEVKVTCWPLTLVEKTHAVPLSSEGKTAAAFAGLSIEALTSFFAFELTARVGDKKSAARFTLNLPLEGAPADRAQHVLRAILRNRDRVRRLLLLLLMESDLEAAALWLREDEADGKPAARFAGGAEPTLFEALVRALDRGPAKIDEVANLVKELQTTPESASLLPDHFDKVWEPIRRARERLRK